MHFCAVIVLIVFGFVLKSSCEVDIVQELLDRFYDESGECLDSQGVAKPLYECSGIIIRGVKFHSNETKFAWSLKSGDKEKNSFSFAFLRNDHSFSSLIYYDAGYILYPHQKTPIKKNKQQVLCAFPVNAGTDARNDRGCGQSRSDTTGVSRKCDVQNITTFTDWLAHYDAIMAGEDPWFEISQCGFDTTKETAAQNFAVAMEANAFLQKTDNPRLNSEMRVEGWDENNAKKIPIQSFFYFINNETGRANAEKFRDDFYVESNGEKVPIVGIRLPNITHPEIQIEAAEDDF